MRLFPRRAHDEDRPKRLLFDLPRGLQVAGGATALGALGVTVVGDSGAANPQNGAPVKPKPSPSHTRTAESLGIQTGLPSWIKLPGQVSEGRSLLSVRAAASEVVSKADIKRAERTLTKAGFHPGEIDGEPTPAFARAVSQFQTAWGLEATGVLDEATIKKLDHVAERMRNHPDYLGIGQAGRAVAQLQEHLLKLGYEPETDGIYGQKTGKAMRLFRGDQKELTNGSTLSTPRARKVLRKEVRALAHAPYHSRVKNTAQHKRMEKRTMQAVSRNGGVGLGAQGPVVEYIQQHLRAAGFDPQKQTKFEERTEGMVVHFQKKAGLPQTGVVDRATWIELRKSKMEARDATTPPQRIGERSRAVLASEKRLHELKRLKKRHVDGVYTQATQRAVDDFRDDKNLGHKGSGIGPRVDRALKKAVYQKRHALKGHWTTGYVNGNAYRIKVVKLEGELVEIKTARAYLKMKKAAARDGIRLSIVSGFRTMAEQQYLYNCYISGNPNCNPAAPPGYSNHQSGIALDLNTTGPSDAVGSGPVYNWLARNGGKFGFSRIASEHWHWEYHR